MWQENHVGNLHLPRIYIWTQWKSTVMHHSQEFCKGLTRTIWRTFVYLVCSLGLNDFVMMWKSSGEPSFTTYLHSLLQWRCLAIRHCGKRGAVPMKWFSNPFSSSPPVTALAVSWLKTHDHHTRPIQQHFVCVPEMQRVCVCCCVSECWSKVLLSPFFLIII